ncbi:MAG: DUF805 domain-containing protein [Acidobacteria bacterium]|nr:DUF805 domain-containing protein [Acidobacteriota bacterium]
MSWYLAVLKKYAVFRGRARRKEYWMFFLVHITILIVLGFADGSMGTARENGLGTLGALYVIATFLPTIGAGIRRLHDTGRRGWWMLLTLVPLVGTIILLVLLAQAGQPGDNQYGPDPKAAAIA